MHSSSSSPPTLLVAILLATALFLVVFRNWDSINHPCLESGDYASNALSVETAKTYQQTAGPYSRFKFQHPGPIYFYYLALGESLLASSSFPGNLQSHFSAHSLSQIVLNMTLLFIAAIVVSLSTRRIAPGLLLVLLQAYFLSALGDGFWSNTWGPTVIVIPITVCIVSAAAVASGNAFAAFPMMLGAALATQTHVGTIPLLFPLVAIALVRWGYRTYHRSDPRRARSVVAVSCACLLMIVMYIPTFANLVQYGEEGGIYHLIAFFVKKRAMQHGMVDSIAFLSQFYALPVVKWLPPAASMVILFAGMSILKIRWAPFLYELRVLLVVSVPLSVISVSRVVGPLESYLMWFQFGVAGLVLFVILGGVLPIASRQWCQREYASILSCCVLASLIVAKFALVDIPRHTLCSPVGGDSILEDLVLDQGVMYGISLGNRSGGGGPWDTALSLALALRRGGYEFCVHHRIRFMFGDRASCNSITHIDFHDESAFVHLNARNEEDVAGDSHVVSRIGDVVIIQNPSDAPRIRFGVNK